MTSSSLADDVVQAWKRFSRHAAECEPFSPLAVFVRSRPSQPPFDLVIGCCAPGRELVELWLYAKAALVEQLRDLHPVS